MRSAIGLVVLGVLVASSAPFPASPAQAACHIAAFTEDDYPVDETAGSVTITVFLQGSSNTCSGSVAYATADGTATAPGDYTATEGTLCFLAGDEQKTFTVPIADDEGFEGDERFTVRLSDEPSDPGCQPDGISAGDTATVTIASDDPRPAAPPAAATPEEAPTMAPEAPTPTMPPETPGPTAEPTPTDSPTPLATLSPSPLAAAEEDGDGAPILLILGLVAAVLGAGAFGVWWYLRSRAA